MSAVAGNWLLEVNKLAVLAQKSKKGIIYTAGRAGTGNDYIHDRRVHSLALYKCYIQDGRAYSLFQFLQDGQSGPFA